MELVIAAHKSVAQLGVLGQVEHMLAIMDAERDATLAYLDEITKERGGRRGVVAVSTPTTGLVYAHARHATTRAGDPGPHDHVLIANVIEMLDEKGGAKAPDTTLWREHLHAATMVGRVASAAQAVALGYGIEGPRTVGQARPLEDRRHPRQSPGPPLQAGRRDQPGRGRRGLRLLPGPDGWRPGRPERPSVTSRSMTCCLGGDKSSPTPAFHPSSWWPTSSGPGAEYQREYSPTRVLWDRELAKLTNDVLET